MAKLIYNRSKLDITIHMLKNCESGLTDGNYRTNRKIKKIIKRKRKKTGDIKRMQEGRNPKEKLTKFGSGNE